MSTRDAPPRNASTIVVFLNDFHHSSAQALSDGMLNKRQTQRLRSQLCGVPNCRCAETPAGTRGAQFEDARYVLLRSEEDNSWERD